MTEVSAAVQRLIRARLTARAGLVAMVPAANIRDTNGRPEAYPCILIGEGQVVGEDVDCIDLSEVFSDIHVWTKEPGTLQCKMISGEIRRALRGVDDVVDGFDISMQFEGARYLRDPSGEHAHGVLTFVAIASDMSEDV